MKKKIIISFFIVILIFGILVTSDVFAIDEMMNRVLTDMDTAKVGITQESKITKVIRTVYAVLQITVIGGALIYFTAHSVRFFSSDPNERKNAKDGLPYRITALVLILGIDGVITILVNYFTP